MDRKLEKKRLSWQTALALATLLLAAASLTWLVLASPSNRTLTVDPDRLVIAVVEEAQFLEYIPVAGSVEPIHTVYLDAVEGGRVEEIVAEDGKHIDKGDLILRLSNSTLQKEAIATESVLLENMNTLRNTRINLAEKELLLQEELLDCSYKIQQLERGTERQRAIIASGVELVAEADLEATEDELSFQRSRREIIAARISQEKSLREQQLAQVDATILRVERNLEIMAEMLGSLDIHAPIAGHLSTLKAEVGQSISRGQNLGQIDVLDDLKMRCDVDQHYVSRVAVGQIGRISFGDQEYLLETRKIYPEVVGGVFTVDMDFVDGVPQGMKRGQSLRVNLSLSTATDALRLAKGAFYPDTGGRWAFVVHGDRRSASRRAIRLGRQNPEFYEVLDGLSPGESVITSSYDAFGEAAFLEFSGRVHVESREVGSPRRGVGSRAATGEGGG